MPWEPSSYLTVVRPGQTQNPDSVLTEHLENDHQLVLKSSSTKQTDVQEQELQINWSWSQFLLKKVPLNSLYTKFTSGFNLEKRPTVWFHEVYMYLKLPEFKMRFCVVFLLVKREHKIRHPGSKCQYNTYNLCCKKPYSCQWTVCTILLVVGFFTNEI